MFQIEPYQPDQHYQLVGDWIQKRVAVTQGADGFARDRWDTQFSPERMRSKTQDDTALVFQGEALVGVIVTEGVDDIHLLRLESPQDADILVAMTNWLKQQTLGTTFSIWLPESSDVTQFHQLGFHPQPDVCHNHTVQLNQPLAQLALPAGYQMVAVDLTQARWRKDLARVDNLCFPWANSTPQSVGDLQRMPSYRASYHRAVVDPHGNIAAFSILWLDSLNKLAVFEPVATHPSHRRRGLAKAVMRSLMADAFNEGIRQFRVGSFSEEARATYNSVGFNEQNISQRWRYTATP